MPSKFQAGMESWECLFEQNLTARSLFVLNQSFLRLEVPVPVSLLREQSQLLSLPRSVLLKLQLGEEER